MMQTITRETVFLLPWLGLWALILMYFFMKREVRISRAWAEDLAKSLEDDTQYPKALTRKQQIVLGGYRALYPRKKP